MTETKPILMILGNFEGTLQKKIRHIPKHEAPARLTNTRQPQVRDTTTHPTKDSICTNKFYSKKKKKI